jgi:uncharacterized coiled-coil protein SlyX
VTAQSLANRVKDRAGTGPGSSARVMDKVSAWLDPRRNTQPGGWTQDPVPAERILADLQELLGRGGLSADVVAPLVATVRRQAADIEQLSASLRDLAEEMVALKRAHYEAQAPRPLTVVKPPRLSAWSKFLGWMSWAAR